MLRLTFGEYRVELENDSAYKFGSGDNNFKYDFVYHEEDVANYESGNYAIKVFKDEDLYKGALICATGTIGIHKNFAVIVDEDLLICCASKVFNLSLPDLKLNWMRQVDEVCCFQIFKNEVGIFVHGEINASRIDKSGNIIWSQSFADILVTLDGRDSFIMHDDFIEIEDWQHNKYKLDFDGKYV